MLFLCQKDVFTSLHPLSLKVGLGTVVELNVVTPDARTICTSMGVITEQKPGQLSVTTMEGHVYDLNCSEIVEVVVQMLESGMFVQFIMYVQPQVCLD